MDIDISAVLEFLSRLNAPLAAASVILTAFLVSSKLIYDFLRKLWLLSPVYERRVIEQLYTAVTYPRFREILGHEPSMYRDLNRNDPQAEALLKSRFFILPRTFIEAFIDDSDRVYGYTVTLRRRTWMGPIKIMDLSVRLGRSTLREAWTTPSGGDYNPTLIGLPPDRGYPIFEIMKGSGASVGQTLAIGISNAGALASATPLSHWRSRLSYWFTSASAWVSQSFGQTATTPATLEENPYWEIWNAALSETEEGGAGVELETIGEAPGGWHERPERRKVQVNSIAVGLGGEIRLSMLNLHSQEVFAIDPERRRG